MCEYCHREYCCVHGRHRYYPGHVYDRPMIHYYEPLQEPSEDMVEEKRILERRLKEIEARLQHVSK